MTASHPTYYDQRKFEIQKKRLISALDKLAAGDLSARKPSLKSLEKYGLYDPKTHKITTPTHMQPPTLNYSAIPEPEAQPVIQVVRNYDSNPVEKFDLSKAEVTGSCIRDWVYTELSGVAMKTTKVRGKETLNLYANVAKNLCKIRNVPYDDKENVFKYFNDPTTTIEKEEQTRAGKSIRHPGEVLYGRIIPIAELPQTQGIYQPRCHQYLRRRIQKARERGKRRTKYRKCQSHLLYMECDSR